MLHGCWTDDDAAASSRAARLRSARWPFEGKPPVRKNVRWVKPKLVVQVGFAEWTKDGRLRHPRFLGIRDDKRAKDVVREAV